MCVWDIGSVWGGQREEREAAASSSGGEPPFIAGEVSRRQQWQLILGVPSEAERAPKTTSTTLSATPSMPFLAPLHLLPRVPKNHIFSAR